MNGAKSAWEFVLLLGMYYWERLKEAFTKLGGSFSPWDAQTFVAGLASVAYLVGVAVFFAVLIYDGFAWKSDRNFGIVIVLLVTFVVSLIK